MRKYKINYLIFLMLVSFSVIFFSKNSISASENTNEASMENEVGVGYNEDEEKSKPSGGAFIWFLCAIAFLKISLKIDSIMSSLGVNVAHTGGSLLGEAMMTAKALTGGSSGIRGFFGGNKGEGHSLSNPSSESMFSSGLSGMIGREPSQSAFSGKTAEKSGGDLDSSIETSGDFAKFASGEEKGFIDGEIADKAMQSYFGGNKDESNQNKGEIGSDSLFDSKEGNLENSPDISSLGSLPTSSESDSSIPSDIGIDQATDSQEVGNIGSGDFGDSSVNQELGANSISDLGFQSLGVSGEIDSHQIGNVDNLTINSVGGLNSESGELGTSDTGVSSSLGNSNSDYLDYDKSTAGIYEAYQNSSSSENQSAINSSSDSSEMMNSTSQETGSEISSNESGYSDYSDFAQSSESQISSLGINSGESLSIPTSPTSDSITSSTNNPIGSSESQVNSNNFTTSFSESSPSISTSSQNLGANINQDSSNFVNSKSNVDGGKSSNNISQNSESNVISSSDTSSSKIPLTTESFGSKSIEPNAGSNFDLAGSSPSVSIPENFTDTGSELNSSYENLDTGNSLENQGLHGNQDLANDIPFNENLNNNQELLPKFENIEIGNGMITGIEKNIDNPDGIEFAMYSKSDYLKPDGNFEEVTSNDGKEWYKQFAEDTEIKKPQVNFDTGKIEYKSELVKTMPDAPAKKDRL